MKREPTPGPVTYHETIPVEYVRGDGKPFWRPCVLRVIGSNDPEVLGMTERYDGWLDSVIVGWEKVTPSSTSDPDSAVPINKKRPPKLYSSRKKAIRVSKRFVKKYNKEQLMLIRKV